MILNHYYISTEAETPIHWNRLIAKDPDAGKD